MILIAVGTPVDASRQIMTGHLETACAQLAPVLRPGQLVILKSTVAPGTTQGLVAGLLERGGLAQGRDFGLAFCPERLAEGSALAQFGSIPMVVGGCDEESTAAAAAFWSSALNVEVIEFASPGIAELVKLADNWWIDANIALANELAKLCGALDVDVLDVIAGANSLPKGSSHVNVLLPSVGVGGSCLTKDPWILWTAARQHGIDLRMARTAREVNDTMPGYTHDLICSGLRRLGKDPARARVAVLGLAFKNNTNDLRNTPVKPVVAALRASCREVAIFDPLVTPECAAAEFGLEPAGSVGGGGQRRRLHRGPGRARSDPRARLGRPRRTGVDAVPDRRRPGLLPAAGHQGDARPRIRLLGDRALTGVPTACRDAGR